MFAARGPFIFQTPVAPPSGGDPYWDDVSFLYYFDNTLTDEKGNFTLESFGDNALSSTESKFGGYSMYNGNANTGDNYASISGTSTPLEVGTGDYTFECWWYPVTPGFTVFNKGVLQLNADAIFAVSAADGSYYLARWNGSNFDVGTSAVSLNQWTHVCWTRDNGTAYFGVGGTLQQFRTSDTAFNVTSLTSQRLCSTTYTNESLWGYIDSARFTKGVNRYGTGATYTVPTAEFPNN